MKKLLLLFGTDSFEHEVSIISCKNIIKNIDRKKFIFDVVGISKDNEWFLVTDYEDLSLYSDKQIYNVSEFVKMYDVIFPVIHGKNGEDGKLQGFLDICGIKYVGSNLISSSICMDKAYCKIICEKYRIPQIDYIILKKGEKLNKKISYPVIVKPANGGSSIGISIVNNKKELKTSINNAFKYDDKIIIEKYIKARELECAVIETKNKIIIDVGEVLPSNTFYDYEDKYLKNETKYDLYPKIDKKIIKEIKDYSRIIFDILECKDLARIDFLYDYTNNKVYFNEINTMPGFTDISMYPMILSKNNLNLKDIITILINNNS